MANVVRDPREHPDAIIPDLSTNKVSKFTKGSGGIGVRQHLEAALLHQSRRRLLSATRSMDIANKTGDLIMFLTAERIGGRPSILRQHAAAPGPDLRWLPFVNYDIHTKQSRE